MKNYVIPIIALILAIILYFGKWGKLIYQIYPCYTPSGPLHCTYFYDVKVNLLAIVIGIISTIVILVMIYMKRKKS